MCRTNCTPRGKDWYQPWSSWETLEITIPTSDGRAYALLAVYRLLRTLFRQALRKSWQLIWYSWLALSSESRDWGEPRELREPFGCRFAPGNVNDWGGLANGTPSSSVSISLADVRSRYWRQVQARSTSLIDNVACWIQCFVIQKICGIVSFYQLYVAQHLRINQFCLRNSHHCWHPGLQNT